ncbi:GDSL lipase/esterase [Arabidopsis suecica]|uniref:GDSL lipase/esterase n=1 Tax=Arabidopsis suecica TaxID=45249 RepID=A0A8T2C9X8_ARASU|nr:GDSL lipase/esterase [Arabidopsis suecica]
MQFSTTCHAYVINVTNVNVSMFPAILGFGDSTIDTGNNNYIKTYIRANFPPYGCNFPGHNATGRFSNGKLIPDFIASLMGIKDTVPPFLDPHLSDSDIITGVCFASAGSGYDNLTDRATSTLSVDKQADMLRSYVERLSQIVGDEKAASIVSEALVIVSSGTNDFNLNLYDTPSRRQKLGVDGYQSFILSNVHNFVQELYDIGCRKIMVLGLPPVGCLPIQMTMAMQKQNERRCIDKQNSDSQEFNQKLKNSLTEMQSNLTGSVIFYGDIYGALFDMATNPQRYGLKETTRGCCGTGEIELAYLCNALTRICPNPNQYLFWDDIHPSQIAYIVISLSLVEQIFHVLS